MAEQVLEKAPKAKTRKKTETPPTSITPPAPTASAAKRKETFSFEAPGAQRVLLVGEFTDWEDGAVEMKKQKDGTWKATVSLDPGVYEYRYIVDGEWRDDESCSTRRPNAFGAENCVREVA